MQWFSSQPIEIPGQYTGKHRPQKERHTKIVKFHPTLQVFTSLRVPIVLGIYGSDGEMHKFVVKYGEDLRQDERIQQLLQVMNSKLQQDKHCRSHKLDIVTYQIIPMSSCYGILEMVPNVTELKTVCSESLQRRTNTNFITLQKQQIGSLVNRFKAQCKLLSGFKVIYINPLQIP